MDVQRSKIAPALTVQVGNLAPFTQPHPLSFAFAQQLPQRWSRGRFAPDEYHYQIPRFLSGIVTGRVRAVTYRYKVRRVFKKS